MISCRNFCRDCSSAIFNMQHFSHSIISFRSTHTTQVNYETITSYRTDDVVKSKEFSFAALAPLSSITKLSLLIELMTM